MDTGGTLRILALGGHGTFGRYVAKNLCADNLVTEIVIAGRDLDSASKFAEELGSKATAAKVNALNEDEIRSAAQGSDLLVNTAGPDYRVSFPAARAAIKAGTDYCDLCADADTTERLLRLSPEAEDADATILLGIGFGPGETNLLMKHAASHMDSVEDVKLLLIYNLIGMIYYFGVKDPGKAASEMRRTGRVNASWETVMNWAGGRVCVFRGGKLIDVDPSMCQERIEFGDSGNPVFFPVGGPEAVTIPRFLRNVHSASFMMSVYPPEIGPFFLNLADRMRKKEIDAKEATVLFHERVAAMQAEGTPPTWKEQNITLKAIATGVKDGRRIRYSCWPAWNYMEASSALTVAASRMLRGEVHQKGVLAPEACFDPMEFFEEASLLVSKDSRGKKLLVESLEEVH